MADLTDDQLTWSPKEGAHSIGFALWHIARCDDNYLRSHIQGRSEIWQEEEWSRQWELDLESTGTLLTDEEMASLPFLKKPQILAYAERVWQ